MRRFYALTLFAVGFAVVEASIVVYLRELFYPSGFNFPLKTIPDDILRVEMWREAATLVVLGSVGAVAGRTRWQKFAFFMYVFGLWDIFYYIWLKVLINWPESFFAPDVLFLLPVVWWGPVLAPVLVGVSLCASAMVIVRLDERGHVFKLKPLDVAWVTLGAFIIFYTFMIDSPIIEAGKHPPPYRWSIFFIGEAVGIAAFTRMVIRK